MSKGEERRRAILERALEQVSASGLEGLTIGVLAKDVGMSKSGLFAHFQSKEQLQVDVLRAATERFVQVVVSPALRAPRGEPRVRALFDRWLDWERRFPGGCPYQTAIAEFESRPGPVRDYLEQTQRDWLDTLVGAAGIAVQEGHFRADLDTRLFAFQLLCLTLGYHRHAQLSDASVADSLTRAAFEQLLDHARR